MESQAGAGAEAGSQGSGAEGRAPQAAGRAGREREGGLSLRARLLLLLFSSWPWSCVFWLKKHPLVSPASLSFAPCARPQEGWAGGTSFFFAPAVPGTERVLFLDRTHAGRGCHP